AGIATLVNGPALGVAQLLSAPALVRVGRISYGLYLWHFPMLSLAPKLLHGLLPITRRVAGLNELLAFAAAFGAATLSSYWVERPLLRWKARLGMPERSPTMQKD